MIIFKQQTATFEEIRSHLLQCNASFIPALDKTVHIDTYAKKLADHAVHFEAWDHKILVGLIAVYLNDSINKTGFITNVSTSPQFTGKGIAVTLMNNCIRYAIQMGFSELMLEVAEANTPAIQLYRKFHFENHQSSYGKLLMKRMLDAPAK